MHILYESLWIRRAQRASDPESLVNCVAQTDEFSFADERYARSVSDVEIMIMSRPCPKRCARQSAARIKCE